MILFSCKNLEMAFGADTVLEDVNLAVNEGDRIGIIGSNGAGKTTLIKLFTGEYLPSAGSCFIHSAVRSELGYLRQDSGLDSTLSVYDEFMLPYAELKALEAEIADTESKLIKYGDGAATGRVLSGKLSALYEKYTDLGGLTYESRVRSVLKGLGFEEEAFGRAISTLSGGQKTRLALGKLLLRNPRVLILDEPTNHLDEESCVWLETELKAYTGTLLVISHDRAFLDAVTSRTLLIENGGAFMYNAPYSKYTVLRENDVEYQRRCYLQQQKEIARINAFIENQRRWNRERNIVAVGSRLKYLDRMEKLEKPAGPEDPPAISFSITIPGGNDVLKTEALGFAFPGRVLFRNLSFEVHKGERVFITGPNGSGKTTLLRLLAGRLTDAERSCVSGTFRIGINTGFSYYSQDLSDVSGEGTVFDALYDRVNEGKPAALLVPPVKLRSSLAAMGFRGADVFKNLSELSGGEKSRLQLLMISYERRPLLILDEPTNHLDIGSREALEKALLKFEGTCLIVSHDRYFRSKLATRTLDIGDYAEGAGTGGGERGADRAGDSEKSKGALEYKKQKERRSQYNKLRNELKRLETQLAAEADEAARLEAEIAGPEISSDHVKLAELYTKKNALEDEMFANMARVEELTHLLAEFEEVPDA